ncbi:DUF4240 domain-containing protein [Shimazuella kribbensis]|uniref:DUF4240 domain-containing protein n=1 Tax=Shimazuella kribbensis TaxID=139808 RepID=UPI0004903327|nr:DUF4240 domain-containing protein [Shimazuella kribbensis]
MRRILIYRDSTSEKFWEINVIENTFLVTYGKIGTTGTVKMKEFESEEISHKEADKLIQSKLKKGYVIADSTEDIVKKNMMSETLFWELLETAKKKEEDPEDQLEWLELHLSRKPIKDIVEFDFILKKYYYQSYTSDLWAAAYIIMGGCSDDSFDYFRAWLLFLGKETYESIINNPESIIPHLQPLEIEQEVPELEDLLYVASMAYEEKTGFDDEHYSKLYKQISGDKYLQPSIELDWDEEDMDSLRKKFPLLWDRYSQNPLE